MKKILVATIIAGCFFSCAKKMDVAALKDSNAQQAVNATFYFVSLQADDQTGNISYYNVQINPTFKLKFSMAVDTSAVSANIQLKQNNTVIPVKFSYTKNDTVVVIKPVSSLQYI